MMKSFSKNLRVLLASRKAREEKTNFDYLFENLLNEARHKNEIDLSLQLIPNVRIKPGNNFPKHSQE